MSNGRQFHVCVVEDYPDAQVMVEKMLRHSGMEVTVAGSGAILDSLLGQGLEPDLFLLDLVLPGESGVSIMRRLRSERRWDACPIVALTAYGYARDRREALGIGFDGYLTKPVDMSSFTRKVREFLTRGRVARVGALQPGAGERRSAESSAGVETPSSVIDVAISE